MLQTGHLQLHNGAGKTAEKTVLALTGVYLLCMCIRSANYEFPVQAEFMLLLGCLAVCTCIRLLLDRPHKGTFFLALLTAMIYLLTYQNGKEFFLLFLGILTIGTIGIDYKKVVRLYAAVVGAFCVLWIISALIGLIPNVVNYRAGKLRSCWGMSYPTDFASLLLFLLLMTWLGWDRVTDTDAVLAGILLFFFSWKVTDSRTTMMCSALLVLLAGMHLPEQACTAARHPRLYRAFDGGRKMMAASFPIGVFVTGVLCTLYARGTAAGLKLDSMLTSRLRLTVQILRDQGIHPFGKVFSQSGQVGSGASNLPPMNLYFLDNSYAHILIRYGWVMFLAVGILWTALGIRAYRNKDRRLLTVMTVIAFHALTEHHFKDLHYNILLALPFAAIPVKKSEENDRKARWKSLRSRMPEMLVTAVSMIGIICMLPLFLNRMRTVLCIHGSVERWSERLVVISWIAIQLAVLAVFVFSVGKLAGSVMRKEKQTRAILLAGLLSAVFLCGVYTGDEVRIRRAAAEYAAQLDADEEAVMTVLQTKEGKLVSEVYPELYRMRWPEITRTVLYGDDLARFSNMSIITERGKDRYIFSKCGFYYTAISASHAIYSNDKHVISALEAAGFSCTAYYSDITTLDLNAHAEDNELPFTPEGAILLESGTSMTNGPWADLYAGDYLLKLRLHAVLPPMDGEQLCTVAVEDNYHQRELAKQEFYTNQLDAAGNMEILLPFHTGGSRAAEFCVYAAPGLALEISEICYQKTGAA